MADPSAVLSEAMRLHQAGRIDEAAKLYDQLLGAFPAHPETLHLRGVVDLQLGRFPEALQRFDRAIAAQPNHAGAHTNRGAVLIAMGRFEDALTASDRALSFQPSSIPALDNRASALNKLGQYGAALGAATQALVADPRHHQAHGHRAVALSGLGRHGEALSAADNAIALSPKDPEVHTTRASVLQAAERWSEALASCDRAIALDRDNAPAHSNRGALLLHLNRKEESLAACERALTLDPQSAAAHVNRGNALLAMKRFDDAIGAFDQALALSPRDPDIYLVSAHALFGAGRGANALINLDNAIGLRPDFRDAFASRAEFLVTMRRYSEALDACDQALALAPDHVEAIILRAKTLVLQGKHLEEALTLFERAHVLRPSQPVIAGEALFLALRMGSWAGLAERVENILRRIDEGVLSTLPMMLMAVPSSPAQQRKAATLYIEDATYPTKRTFPAQRADKRKIRIGYFSSDFYDHPVGHLMVALIEAHDRSQFEIIGFAFGGEPADSVKLRLARAFDRMNDVSAMSDEQVAALCRESGIDIAVDLNGNTGNPRTRIFAAGAAPIQVNYLGYPGTMGSNFHHYIIADQMVAPPESSAHFSENIVAMPHAYLPCNDTKRHVPIPALTRAQAGLPERGFVFACFNGTFKITPDVFDIWMRLLSAVEGSVLWLSAEHDAAMRNLRLEAEKRGISGDRLVFATRAQGVEYLARFRMADLFLDTFYYNAHATAADALVVGLPVLTRRGETFAARVAASLLTVIGLPELVTDGSEGYEKMALSLATNPEALEGVRRKLNDAISSSPLFDTKRYARNLETAYREMVRRFEAGLAPDRIDVVDKG